MCADAKLCSLIVSSENGYVLKLLEVAGKVLWSTWEVFSLWEKVAVIAVGIGAGGVAGVIVAFSNWSLWLQALASASVAAGWLLMTLFMRFLQQFRAVGPASAVASSSADRGSQAMSHNPGGVQIGGNVGGNVIVGGPIPSRDANTELRQAIARFTDAAAALVEFCQKLHVIGDVVRVNIARRNERRQKQRAFETTRDELRIMSSMLDDSTRQKLLAEIARAESKVWDAVGSDSNMPEIHSKADAMFKNFADVLANSQPVTGPGLRSRRTERRVENPLPPGSRAAHAFMADLLLRDRHGHPNQSDLQGLIEDMSFGMRTNEGQCRVCGNDRAWTKQ